MTLKRTEVSQIAKLILREQINSLTGIDDLLDEAIVRVLGGCFILTEDEKEQIRNSWEKKIDSLLDKLG